MDKLIQYSDCILPNNIYFYLFIQLETLEKKFKLKRQQMYELERKTQEQTELKEKSIQETNVKLTSLQQHYKLLKIQFEDFKEDCSKSGTQQLLKLKTLNSENKALQNQNEQWKV